MEASVAGKLTPHRPGIAERLWDAARIEFSERGYHGARVQGIARRAGCNVALLYRHWTSKKALYLDLLRSVWKGTSAEMLAQMQQGRGASAVVSAYLGAHMRDPVGAQIIIREVLDGSPFLGQLVATEPSLTGPLQQAAAAIDAAARGDGAPGEQVRPEVDGTVAALTIGGLAALVASAHQAARPFLSQPLSAEEWRRHVHDLLLHGLLRCPEPAAANEAS
jgi:TetR/AcrR family transcriptional regulator